MTSSSGYQQLSAGTFAPSSSGHQQLSAGIFAPAGIDISLLPAATEAEAGRLPPPARAEAAAAQTPLNSPQQAMAIGEPIPVVFCRRRNNVGGVLIFPKATEAAFSNTSTHQTARYHCVLGIGPMGSVQVRDFRVGACRVGSFSQNYDKRAGAWAPGNTATPQAGYQVPTFPTACGGGGNYKGLATLEFSNTTTGGTDDWSTGCNVFIRDGLIIERGRLLDGGVGASDNIADLVLWAWQRSSRVPAGMIDMDSLAAAARFCDVNGLLCNGEFTDSANIGDWLIGLLPYFLLRETKIGGKFGLRPLLPTNIDGTINTSTLAPRWVLSESVIAPGSFSQDWSDAGTRLAPRLTMLWRQQSETDKPIVRSLAVGFNRAGPAEQHDMSRFGSTEIHAARAGAYIHGRRYLSTHTAKVTLIPGNQTGQISQGDIVVINLPLVTGREPDGLISDWYAVEQVEQFDDGSEALTLSHFPVDSQARSLLALEVAGATAPGALLPFPAIGACDVAGRSADTSVPAPSTSGPPFSGGGGGISIGTPGGGGGGGYNETPIPDYGPPSEDAPESPPVNPAAPGGTSASFVSPYEKDCPSGPQVVNVRVYYTGGFAWSIDVFGRSFVDLSTRSGAKITSSKYINIYYRDPSGLFDDGTPLTGTPGEPVRARPYTIHTLSYTRAVEGTTTQIQLAANALYPLYMETTSIQCRPQGGEPGPEPEPSREVRRYTVVSGDTLYDIAGKLLGNVNRWPEIYALNTEIIDNPDLIYPGQVLSIPLS
jgi:nucleoid-associated protein YgaU